jgi:DNA invertase Pin-like site-specific DNA recombinase
LMNLMRKISEGKIKNVWCFNNDRLSRNENVWFTIRRQFKLNDVTLFVGEGTKLSIAE